MEVPNIKDIYWSQTRAYLPYYKEWASIDPTFIYSPEKLLKHKNNWNYFQYASGDPINFVDPSGYFTQDFWYQMEYFGVREQVFVEMKDISKGYQKGLKNGVLAIGVISLTGGTIQTASLIEALVLESSLQVGSLMALNPEKTTIISGIINGIMDERYGARTGFPNLDLLGATSEELGKLLSKELDNIIRESSLENTIDIHQEDYMYDDYNINYNYE